MVGLLVEPLLVPELERLDGGHKRVAHVDGFEVSRVWAVGLADERLLVGRVDRFGALVVGGAPEAAVGQAIRVDGEDLADDVRRGVVGSEGAPALGRVAVPEARALIEAEDVGLVVGDLRQRGDVGDVDGALVVVDLDETAHRVVEDVERRGQVGLVRIEAVPVGRNDHAVVAAVLARGGGLLDDLLFLLLLVRRRVLLIGLVGLLVRLLRGRLLLLRLLGGGLLRLVLLLGDGDGLLRVVVIAAADQGEAGCADARPRGGAQERPPTQPLPPHSLPVVAFRHFSSLALVPSGGAG